MKKRTIAFAAAVGAIVIGSGAFAFFTNSGIIKPDDQQSVGKVLATVDGYKITQIEITPMVQQGIDPAVALDRRITQSVIAKAAEADFRTEAELLMAANRNDILYQLFLSKKSESIKKSITDKDIEAFYQKNVHDEDFKKVGLRIFLTSDAREAQTFYESLVKAIESKEAEAIVAKMNYLQKDGDHLQSLESIPYNLGQVIKKMKQGQALAPIVIREGVMVAYVESMKESAKPTMAATKEEIRSILVNERLGAEIQALRKAATIHLKN